MATILLASSSGTEKVRRLLEQNPAWKVVEAPRGSEALESLDREEASLCLTDAELPDMEPEEFLQAVRRKFPRLPVVLLTPSPNEAVVRALRFGAASYVPRTSLARDLASTVSRVLGLCEEREGEEEALSGRTSATASFELGNEPAAFPPLVSHIMLELARFGLTEGNDRVYAGVAIEEALLNAMIHGNLAIHSSLREEGFEAYEELVQKRRGEPPYRHRRIRVEVAFDANEARITVRDEGEGFDAASLPDPRLPENVVKLSGRGLLLMRSFMDVVRFNAKGNEVTLIKRRPADAG